MSPRTSRLAGLLVAGSLLSLSLIACDTPGRGPEAEADVAATGPAPPPAQRPVIRSEAELAAERQQRIAAGQQVPVEQPAIAAPRPTAPRRPLAAPRAAKGAIASDLLMVNDVSVTVSEVLYLLRTRLDELQADESRDRLHAQIEDLVRSEVQRQIGTILVHKEALASLDETRRRTVEQATDKEIARIRQAAFEGSPAKLAAHLREHNLSEAQFRTLIERDMVVREYTRERLLGRVQIRRDDLLTYYRDHKDKFGSPETRELLVIELPFERFLPAGSGSWERAPRTARAAAKLAAVRRAREAHAALASRPFADVAREFSLGPKAEDGGSWGMIGKPLQPPFDQISEPIFAYQSGQYGEPVELETGWYIAGCGRIEPAVSKSFDEVQEQVRRELYEARFQKLSREYVLRLAEKATVSDVEAFVDHAVSRAIAVVPEGRRSASAAGL